MTGQPGFHRSGWLFFLGVLLMADLITLASARTEIRQRTHLENSQFVTDAELNTMINKSRNELYDLLIASAEDWNGSSADFTISSGNTFSPPADFYKFQGLDYIVSLPDKFQSLRRVIFGERNSGRQGYNLRDGTVTIYPYSWAAGKTFRLYYAPVPAALVNDSDTFDGVDGWSEYVVVDVCLKIAVKSNGDPAPDAFAAQKQAMVERIQALAAERDENEPAHVADINSSDAYGAYYNGRFILDY